MAIIYYGERIFGDRRAMKYDVISYAAVNFQPHAHPTHTHHPPYTITSTCISNTIRRAQTSPY